MNGVGGGLPNSLQLDIAVVVCRERVRVFVAYLPRSADIEALDLPAVEGVAVPCSRRQVGRAALNVVRKLCYRHTAAVGVEGRFVRSLFPVGVQGNAAVHSFEGSAAVVAVRSPVVVAVVYSHRPAVERVAVLDGGGERYGVLDRVASVLVDRAAVRVKGDGVGIFGPDGLERYIAELAARECDGGFARREEIFDAYFPCVAAARSFLDAPALECVALLLGGVYRKGACKGVVELAAAGYRFTVRKRKRYGGGECFPRRDKLDVAVHTLKLVTCRVGLACLPYAVIGVLHAPAEEGISRADTCRKRICALDVVGFERVIGYKAAAVRVVADRILNGRVLRREYGTAVRRRRRCAA